MLPVFVFCYFILFDHFDSFLTFLKACLWNPGIYRHKNVRLSSAWFGLVMINWVADFDLRALIALKPVLNAAEQVFGTWPIPCCILLKQIVACCVVSHSKNRRFCWLNEWSLLPNFVFDELSFVELAFSMVFFDDRQLYLAKQYPRH